MYQGVKAVSLDWNKLVFWFGHSRYMAGAGSSIEQSEISGFKGDLIDFHSERMNETKKYQI